MLVTSHVRPCSCTAGAAPYNDPYRLYNLDVFEYLEDHPFGLYGSIPVMLGHKKGLTVGVFWWVKGAILSVSAGFGFGMRSR